MAKAIFLDRDGTIIKDVPYLNDPDLIEFLPGSIEGLKAFRDMGFLLLVATNQSGVPRGIVELKNLFEIHRRMDEHCKSLEIKIEHFYYAPHLPESDSPLRKPNPGMLLEGAKEFDVDLSQSWMIGDKMTDVEAGHRAGTRSLLIGPPEVSKKSQYQPPAHHCANLLECAAFIRELDHKTNES